MLLRLLPRSKGRSAWLAHDDFRSPSATSMSAKRCGGRAASVRSADAATSAENTLAMSDCARAHRNHETSIIPTGFVG